MRGQLTIQDIDNTWVESLETTANQKGIDLNTYLLQIIKQVVQPKKSSDNSNTTLLKLAGTWSEKDCQEFERNTTLFNQIDEELW